MSTNEIVTACRLLSDITIIKGRKDKEILLREKDSYELRFLLETAFNPYLTYGVKDFEVLAVRTDPPELDELKKVRDQLVNREITGHAAVKLLQDTIGIVGNLQASEILRKAFSKELKIGLDVKSINKIFPNLIPTFDIGLCDTFESNTLPNGEWAIEPKYDGSRCIAFINSVGDITFYSRTGKVMFNMEFITKELKKLELRNVVLDGEIFGKDWHLTVSITHTQTNHADKEQLKFHIFDMVNMAGWVSQDSFSTPKYVIRKELIKSTFEGKSSKLVVTPSYQIQSYDEAENIYKKLLQAGFEGAVLKNINSGYPFGRSKDWLKWKPVQTYDVTITGYEEGEGRNKGKLGAFICDFEGEKIKVGNGYDDNLRETFWKEKDKMIGKIIEVECQEITKDKKLRFPVYIRFRQDR